MKYIRNTDDANIVCRISSDKNRSFLFKNKKIDKMNGTMLSNGYTEISDEEIAILRAESDTFKYYEKKGRLTVVENLPFESMSADQLIAALRTENSILKQELRELKAGAGKNGSEQLKETIKKLEELNTKQELDLAVANEELAEKEKIIEALDLQLTEAAEKQKKSKKAEKED